MKHSHPRRQRGAALIEFALCSVLLMLMLFGVLDVGLLLGDRAALGEAAREAARSLSLGSAPSVATDRALAATGLPLTSADIVLEESVPDSQGSPTVWTAVGTGSSGGNDAMSGDFVRATITYVHPLITTVVIPAGKVTLTASLVMRRE